jgi:hypothetical protein
MSGHSVFLTLAFCFVLTACITGQTPPPATSLPNSTTVARPADPTSSTHETQPVNPPLLQATPSTTPISDYMPRPGDAALSRAKVFLDANSIVTQGTDPMIFLLNIKGNLPTPCNQLRVLVNPPDSQYRILLEVYSVADPKRMCVQILKPFEQMIPLGSYPSGHYVIYINGKQIGEFDA